jgi:hypothetical protein
MAPCRQNWPRVFMHGSTTATRVRRQRRSDMECRLSRGGFGDRRAKHRVPRSLGLVRARRSDAGEAALHKRCDCKLAAFDPPPTPPFTGRGVEAQPPRGAFPLFHFPAFSLFRFSASDPPPTAPFTGRGEHSESPPIFHFSTSSLFHFRLPTHPRPLPSQGGENVRDRLRFPLFHFSPFSLSAVRLRHRGMVDSGSCYVPRG